MATSSKPNAFPLAGGCPCEHIRYRMLTAPLITHCCHCHRCQRETGSAFVLNAITEPLNIETLTGTPQYVRLPTESGGSHRVARCPVCCVALWSFYEGDDWYYVRAGTLDQPEHCPPDVHIYVASKQPWVVLPEGARAFEEYYDGYEVWSEESLKRRDAYNVMKVSKKANPPKNL